MRLHAPILTAPTVIRLIGDADLLTSLKDRLALRKEHIRAVRLDILDYLVWNIGVLFATTFWTFMSGTSAR